MINIKCTKCSVNLGSENLEHQQQAASGSSDGHYQQQQLTPHHNSHLYKTQASSASTGSSGGSASSLSNSHGYPHQQQYYQQQFSSQSNGGERSRNASSTSLNNQNINDLTSSGSNPNLSSQPKLTHRPPPPIPSQQQVPSRPLHHPQISSAPIFGQPTIPFVPGIGVVAPSTTPQPSTNNRSPFVGHNHNHNNPSSNSSPNFGAAHR